MNDSNNSSNSSNNSNNNHNGKNSAVGSSSLFGLKHDKAFVYLCEHLAEHELSELIVESDYSEREIEILAQGIRANISVQYVSIGAKKFKGDKNRSIGLLLEAIATLPNLKTLRLESGGAVRLPLSTWQALQQCQHLTKLQVYDTIPQVEQEEKEEDDEEVTSNDDSDYDSRNASNKDLALYFNLAQIAVKLPHLYTLTLEQCGLQDDHVLELYRCFKNNTASFSSTSSCSSIRSLSVARNPKISRHVIPLLCSLPNITCLDLSHCRIDSPKLQAMAVAIQEQQQQENNSNSNNNSNSLTRLNLSHNPKLSTDITVFIEFFQVYSSQQLKHLNLSHCGLQQTHVELLASHLKNNTSSLLSLNLLGNATNFLSDPAIQQIKETNPNLINFMIQKNKILSPLSSPFSTPPTSPKHKKTPNMLAKIISPLRKSPTGSAQPKVNHHHEPTVLRAVSA